MISSYSSSTNVTFILTRYSVTLLFSTLTVCSLTHAPLISLNVLAAREIPCCTASSKLFVELR